MVEERRSLEADEQFCSSCGEIIKKLSEFCTKCGVSLGESPSGEQVSKKSPPNTKVIWIIASLLIPLVGIGAGLKYLLTKNRRRYGCLLFCFGLLSILMWGSSIGSDSGTNQSTAAKVSVPTKTPQEIKAQAVDIAYDPLYRNIETHTGKIVHLMGKVVQVSIVGGDRYNLRLAMDGEYDQIVWVTYRGDRVLDDDIVEVWGTVEGLYSYKSVLGAKITIPEINSLVGVVNPTAQ